ncbi:hypothetical protein WQ50_08770, partial [Acinetobacter baumannii]
IKSTNSYSVDKKTRSVHIQKKQRIDPMAQNPFKALNINIDKIESALTQNGVTNYSSNVKNERETHISGTYKGIDFLIKLMPSGGNTTIGRASGQNNTYFDEIALIIKENC